MNCTITSKHSDKYNLNSIFFYSFVIINGIASFSILFLPLYLYKLCENIKLVGLTYSLVSIVAIIGSPFWSFLADIFGRKKVIVISSFISGIVLLIIGNITNVYVLILLILFLSFLSLFGVIMGIITDIYQEQKYIFGYSVLNIINYVSRGMGATIGGYIISYFSYKSSFMLSGFLTLLSIIPLILVRVSDENIISDKEFLKYFKNILFNLLNIVRLKVNRRILVIVGLGNFAGMLTYIFIPIYLNNIVGISENELGLIFMFESCSSILASIVLTYFSNKIDLKTELNILSALFIFRPLVTLAYTCINSFITATIIYLLEGFISGLMFPLFMSFVAKNIKKNIIASFFGTLSAVGEFVEIPANYIGGYLYSNFGPLSIFYVSSIISSFSSIIFLSIYFNFKKKY